jgi:hypothetical protein
MKKQPDYFLKLNVEKILKPKCECIYFPINLSQDFIDSILIETRLSQMIEYLDNEAFLSKYIKKTQNFFNSKLYFVLNKNNCLYR